MNVLEKLTEALTQRGMFKSQAKQVVELAKPKIEALLPEYKISWDQPWNDYPISIYVIWYESVLRQEALDWIEKNIPQAWYKDFFLPDVLEGQTT